MQELETCVEKGKNEKVNESVLQWSGRSQRQDCKKGCNRGSVWEVIMWVDREKGKKVRTTAWKNGLGFEAAKRMVQAKN